MQKYPSQKQDLIILRRARMCDRKTRFNSAAEASGAIANLINWRGAPPRFYLCPYCRGFHLTGTPKREDRNGNLGRNF